MRARLAAMEMELEALKRGSDGGASVAEGGQAADLAAALKEQTEALKEALSARGGSNSITTVKTDLVWPTLTDDKSDTKDVVLFYGEFEAESPFDKLDNCIPDRQGNLVTFREPERGRLCPGEQLPGHVRP